MNFIKHRRLKKRARLALKESRRILKKQRGRGDEKLLALLERQTEKLREALSTGETGSIGGALDKLSAILDNELKPYRKSKLRENCESGFWAVLVVILLRIFIIEPFKIPTGSMEPTLLGVERECPVCHWTGGYYDEVCQRDGVRMKSVRMGDRILVNKFLYGARTLDRIPFTDILLPYLQLPALRGPRRGDIIVFHYPENEGLDYVKRLVGLPGETLEIREGTLFVDGTPVREGKFASLHYTNPADAVLGAPGLKIAVPAPGTIIPLSSPVPDHVRRLIEGEDHHLEEAAGKVLLDGVPVRDYVVENNYYFALGDNSSNSKDSRFWGFIPERNLVGKVVMIYWPPKRIGFPN